MHLQTRKIIEVCPIASDEVRRLTHFMVEKVADEIHWNTADGRIINVNEAACRAMGYTREELLNLRVHDINPECTPDVWPKWWEAVRKHGSLTQESVQRRKNGEIYPTEVRVNFLSFDGKEYACAFVRDITQRRQAEAALRESEQRFRSLLELSPDAVYVQCDKRFALISHAGVRLLGATDAAQIVGRLITDFVHPDYHRLVEERIELLRQGVAVPRVEQRYMRLDGTTVDVEVMASPFPYCGKPAAQVIARDITERKRAEELARKQQAELAHLSRVASVGEMASSLAHELNQPLGAILNYASVCVDMFEHTVTPTATLKETVQEVAKEAKRAAEIVRRMRAFVRKQESQRCMIGINTVVREAMELMQVELRHAGVQPALKLADALPEVPVDPVQIQQVLINLLQNAVDAMGQTPADQRLLLVRSGSCPCGGVRVMVSDAGEGLAPEIHDKLFNSFVTTKPQGLGLGLPISRSIIESHGGRLSAWANPDRGMTFEFVLPSA